MLLLTLWMPLTSAFQQLNFKFLDKVDSKFACSIRQGGRLEGFRSYMRKLWNAVGGNPNPEKSEILARDFRDELTQAYNEAEADWKAIDRDLLKVGLPTVGGVVVSAVANGKFSPEFAASFAVAGVAERCPSSSTLSDDSVASEPFQKALFSSRLASSNHGVRLDKHAGLKQFPHADREMQESRCLR